MIDYDLTGVPVDMPRTGIIWCHSKLETLEYQRFYPQLINLTAIGAKRQQIGIQSLRFNKR